jgi:hypothetical protein
MKTLDSFLGISSADYYSTEDIRFATFLKASGIDLRDIELVEGTHTKCRFIFRVREGDEVFQNLLHEWENSSRCADIKRILFHAGLLRKEIKNFIHLHKQNVDK